jgi:hypothetical protein
VGEQLARYFAAAVGLAVTTVWSFAGFVSALTCLLVAGVCFGATAIWQRGVHGRILEMSKRKLANLQVERSHGVRPRRAPVRTAERQKRVRPRAAQTAATADYRELASTESVASAQYGW